MTAESPSPAAGEPGAAPGPSGRSVGWQLVQVGLLLGLLLVGMYEVDLDARALAEKRARSALAVAVRVAAERPASDSQAHLVESELASYARVCAACAERRRCDEAIQAIRAEMKVPAGRGPCKEGIFERWSSPGPAGDRHAP